MLRALLPLAALLLGLSPPVAAQTAPPASPEPTPSVRGQIALTFDDAPRGNGWAFTGAERADALIAALADVGVDGAMFFVTTGNIDAQPDGAVRLRRYRAAGHTLANHSHTHPWLWQTETPVYLADIDQAGDVLAGFDGVAPFFRFPFLDEGRTAEQRDAVRLGLAERGLRNGYVTIDTYDWYMEALAAEAVAAGHDLDMAVLGGVYVDTLMAGVAFYDAIAVQVLGRSPRHVLLLHENDLAALFVDDLVRALRAEGWEIIPAVEAFADPIADHQPATLFLGQGRVAAIAHEAGMTPRDLVPEVEDEGVLRAMFAQFGLLP